MFTLKTFTRKGALCLMLSTAMLTFSCTDNVEIPANEELDKLQLTVVEDYAKLVHANYDNALQDALALQAAINTFVMDPTQAHLDAAKTAWLASRESYGPSEAFRFYAGPIDDDNGPEGNLNAWPLDEAYIDYVVEGETVYANGIVNMPEEYPTITAQLLTDLNEDGGEENVSLGYHALEFLLWGQDLTAPEEKLAGQRPLTDFTTDQFASRRLDYLKVTTEILIADLQGLVADWSPTSGGNYYASFVSESPATSLKNIFTGIGILAKAELAGERIFTAYDNKNQEDEHSCFSDNTHRDIILNAEGLSNVFYGKYKGTDGKETSGKGIYDLLKITDPALAEQVSTQVTTALEKVNAMPVPFDFAISDEASRPKVLEAVVELQQLGDEFAAAASALDITINTALPE